VGPRAPAHPRAPNPPHHPQPESGLTKESIEKILDGTELTGHGLETAILEIEQEFGINAYFTIAVMKLESGNGKSRLAKVKNNLFGLNATGGSNEQAYAFETKADSVKRFGQLIAKHYVGKGLDTVGKVAKKYCPANPKWARLVENIMFSDHLKL
jgi:beta-N-acetylglucosaminidase